MFGLINQKKNCQFSIKSSKPSYTDYKEGKETSEKFFKDIKTLKYNLDQYYSYKDLPNQNSFQHEDDSPNNFVNFLRMVDLYEPKDSITISKESCSFEIVSHYVLNFSGGQAFSSLCKLVAVNLV
jgi:hypothetical protein